MELTEIQTKLLANVRQMDKLARIISGLPKCEARSKLEPQHDRVLSTIVQLGILKDAIAPESCDYGFMDKCPGCCCYLCEHGDKI